MRGPGAIAGTVDAAYEAVGMCMPVFRTLPSGITGAWAQATEALCYRQE